jgi:hypothetical protein
MVDVVVDAKPMAKLPYDPNDIPEAVRKRAAAVDALYSNGAVPTQAPEPVSASVPVAPVTAVAAPPTAIPTAPPPAPVSSPSPPASEDANSNTWKSRALSLQGRHEKEVAEYQDQLTQLGTELLHAQNLQRQAKARRAPPAPGFLTAEDEQNYGTQLMDFAQRAALHIVAPKLQQVEEQNKQLREEVTKQNRRVLDQAVEQAVPDYREVDRNPRWHKWLLGVDVMSGRVRQTLLNEAISAGNAPRVASFFNGFKQEEVATGHIELASSQSQQVMAPRDAMIPLASLAAPGRARPATGGETSLPQEKPTYTRVQIRDLYRAHQRGAFVGREADWARQEADMFAAQREGRIR